MDTSDIAHQHQVFVVAVAGDVQLDAQAIVGRRGDFQRLGVIVLLEVFLEARVAHQVGHRLAAVLRGLEAEQGFGGAVPPFQVAVAVEHDHRILEGRGGLLDPVDHRLQASAYPLVAALQVVDAVEHVAPQPIAIRRGFVGLVQA